MTRDQIIERVKLLMHVGDRSDLSPSDEALRREWANIYWQTWLLYHTVKRTDR